ncbi:MAG: site-specific DNA-methyltransferase [Firmicutes bacterium]|nr:site-specific DNA-methyltransferase [Bacillota bacterium]
MSLLSQLSRILEDSKTEALALMEAEASANFLLAETCGGASSETGNILARGDNLSFMQFLLKEKDLKGKLDLIYVDPPFFSKSDYGAEIKLVSKTSKKIPVLKQPAYRDTWDKGMEQYLRMLAVRFYVMKELLADTGCLWVHLDWHAVHYVKILLDEIFGQQNFVNEVIWQYKSGGVSKRRFARKHDTLLFYSKTSQYFFKPHQEKSYNREFKPYRFKGVKEYKDELGWYTMVNRKDVWQIDMVGRTSAERTGYVTQKPEALMNRILESCTPEGGLCADFFGGSGTMAAAANKMGRKWISCDIGKLAAINSHKRLIQDGGVSVFYEEGSSPEKAAGTLKVKIRTEEDPLSDKQKLRVELQGYHLADMSSVPVEEKYLDIVKDILETDPLQLINCWSIDYRYDGQTHRPQKYFCKEKGTVETTFETIGNSFEKVSVRAADIFGNSISLLWE